MTKIQIEIMIEKERIARLKIEAQLLSLIKTNAKNIARISNFLSSINSKPNKSS